MLPGRRAFILALMCLLLSLSGCWSRREIETLGFVMAMGIDKAQDEDKLQLTMLVAKPFAMGGGEESNPQEAATWVFSSTGDTVFEAIRNGNSQSPRRLFFAHNRWILFGEEFAREGIQEALDFWSRDGESRRTVHIAVTKDTTASQMLQTRFELERQPSEGGRGVLNNAATALSTVVTVRLNEFAQFLESPGISPVASRVELVPRPKDADVRGEVVEQEIGSSARFTGAAVFNGDRLVGWLDKSETRGLNWVRSEVKSALLIVDDPGNHGERVGIEIISARAQTSVEHVDGRFVTRIKVEAEGHLGDTTAFVEPDTDVWESLEKRMAQVIREEIRAAVSKGQLLRTDFLGFGASFYRSNPRLWSQVKDDWQDFVFPTMTVEIDIRTKLRRTGLVIRSDKIASK
ncbi:MAG: Ger(x)C family spore germination protein [Limnochordia bacterium]|jgi:spore germination protein KC